MEKTFDIEPGKVYVYTMHEDGQRELLAIAEKIEDLPGVGESLLAAKGRYEREKSGLTIEDEIEEIRKRVIANV